MTPGQLAAAVATAGVTPTPRSMLPAPGDSVGTEAATTLGAAHDVMRTLADPAGRLTVVLPASGRAGRAAPSVYWSDLAGPYVLVVETEAGLELEALSTLNDLALWLDRTLLLTALPAATTDQQVPVSIAGYAALLGVVDAFEEARLRRHLDRSAAGAEPITVRDVAASLAAGLTTDHPGWAVSAARAVCPADLAAAERDLSTGIDDLVRAGVVHRKGDELAVTTAGAGLVASLSRPIQTVGIARAASAADSTIGVAHITVHRGVAGIWLALWTALGDDAGCTLVECSAARAATTLVGLVRAS
ncbi:MAG TPA: hypothetical protein VM262_07780 [Acidimicrobiales bacterium]|nr:hypothetical protein [Acidimicrobiales bacterium]